MSGDATHTVRIPVGKTVLEGDLTVPSGARGLVIFSHSGGNSRRNPRNRHVASLFNAQGLATLLTDLLTAEEDIIGREKQHVHLDISLLADRLERMTKWVRGNATTATLPLAYFGAATGAAAAFVAAAREGDGIKAVVSRSGRPDLAADFLPLIRAPALLIVGGNDSDVLTVNRQALLTLNSRSALKIIPDASHTFEEPGSLESVAVSAAEWFSEHIIVA